MSYTQVITNTEETFDEDQEFLDMFVLTFENVELDLVEGCDTKHQQKLTAIKQKLETSFFAMFLEGNDCPNYDQCYEVMEDLLNSMGDEIEYMNFVSADYNIVYHTTTDTEDIPEESMNTLFPAFGEKAFIYTLDEQSILTAGENQ